MNNTTETFTKAYDKLIKEYDYLTALIYGKIERYTSMKLGMCIASEETIADELGVCVMTVRRKKEILIRDGYIEDITPYKKGGSHTLKLTSKPLTLSDRLEADKLVDHQPVDNQPVTLSDRLDDLPLTQSDRLENEKATSNSKLDLPLTLSDRGITQSEKSSNLELDKENTIYETSLRDVNINNNDFEVLIPESEDNKMDKIEKEKFDDEIWNEFGDVSEKKDFWNDNSDEIYYPDIKEKEPDFVTLSKYLSDKHSEENTTPEEKITTPVENVSALPIPPRSAPPSLPTNGFNPDEWEWTITEHTDGQTEFHMKEKLKELGLPFTKKVTYFFVDEGYKYPIKRK